MEKYVAAKVKLNDLGIHDSGYKEVSVLKYIIGYFDNEKNFIVENDTEQHLNNFDECGVLKYIFPISIANLCFEYGGYEGDEFLCDYIAYYIKDICSKQYFQKYIAETDSFNFYKVTNEDLNAIEVDPNLNFFYSKHDEKIIKKLNNNSKCCSINKTLSTSNLELKNNTFFDINYNNLCREVKKVIKGQDSQIEDIVVAIKQHYLAVNRNDNMITKMKANILIAGDTGTGKTKILDIIAKNINVPLVVEDSTKFTEEGYVGRGCDEILHDLYSKADGNLNKAERGIVIMDEIDKKAQIKNEDVVSTKAVFDGLLKIMESHKFFLRGIGEFDTKNIVFVGLGAFAGMNNKIGHPKTAGFNTPLIDESMNTFKQLQPENFINYGIPGEWIGRINTWILMNKITENTLQTILESSDENLLLFFTKLLKEQYNITLQYDENLIEAIAREAFKLKTGARGLDVVIMKTLEEARKEIFSTEKINKKLIINEKTVSNPYAYILK
ncbi:MAG: AAA family ATPase [Bacilli bacterium]